MNQEVSSLAKRLHDIIHFLPPPAAMLHCAPPVSSYSYSPPPAAPGPTVSVAGHWQPHSPLNMPSGLHLHHQAISHPPRNVWGCSRMPSQGMSPSLLRFSSPMSSCLHLCCSDRDGPVGQRFQSPCGIFQTSRTTPNSPYMSHQHLQRAPSFAALSSAFANIPVIGQSPPMAYNPSLPTMSISHSPCSPGNSGYSHPSISVQIDSSPLRSRSTGQPPIHSSVTPAGQSQYQTTFSSLVFSGVNAPICGGHNQSQQQSPMSGSRQSSPIGSSPVHRTQDFAYSLLGAAARRECSPTLGQERTD